MLAITLAEQTERATGPICEWPKVKLNAPSWSLCKTWAFGSVVENAWDARGGGEEEEEEEEDEEEVEDDGGGAAHNTIEPRNRTITKDVHFCMPATASCKLPSGPRSASAGANTDTNAARTTVCAAARAGCGHRCSQ